MNSRVVKLQPLSKESQDGQNEETLAEGMGESQEAKTGLNKGAKVFSQQQEGRALANRYK